MSQPVTRRYDGSGRREQARATRQKVIEAATDSFIERGWSGTSMRDVAKAAGVSVETVYGSAGTKVELLGMAIDIAVVGDDEPVPLSDRLEWRRITHGPTATERAGAVADLLITMHRRTAPLHRALAHAAMGEPELAAMVEDNFVHIREQNRQGIEAVSGRPPTDHELDLVQAALSNDTYLMLTERRGYTDADYREFVVAAITRLLGLDEEER